MADVQCNCGQSGGCQYCRPILNPIEQPVSIPNIGWPTINLTPKGWECPKCSRVYAPSCMECFTCNSLINNGIVRKT
jgi:hypothetical protein